MSGISQSSSEVDKYIALELREHFSRIIALSSQNNPKAFFVFMCKYLAKS